MKTNPNDSINAYVMLDGQGEAGLTKREHFAAMAMQGLLVNYYANGQYGNSIDYPTVSGIAVMCADSLIKELNK